MDVLTLIPSPAAGPSVLILQTKAATEGGEREQLVAIWVSMLEASNLTAAMKGALNEQPVAHDVILSAFEQMGASLSFVLIDRVEGATYFAKLVISRRGKEIEMNARPSDAISLALKTKAPVYVSKDVLNQIACPQLRLRKLDGGSAPCRTQQTATPPCHASSSGCHSGDGHLTGEIAVEQFRAFIEDLVPDDFR
ncbi:bifunctional nuclease family protein [Berryella wangjianweii]|uniref:Bifunctional nuclease family protein n=1 Tax=Berryella wangjianweii TaxID=2734634 RepID=A0A6M8J217_9ACTN|nr:bifunctional nuclease family protein [Berryella wangjianweii]